MRHPHPSRNDDGDIESYMSGGGAMRGDDNPRWPNAPDPDDARTFFTCDACGRESTLVYRCSECGSNPTGSTQGGQR